MVFSSLVFLCVFLPVVIVLYWLIPNLKVRNGLLIIASLLFYAYGEPVYILLMLGSIFLNWLFGLGMMSHSQSMRRFWLILAVLVNIGLLFVFKYLDMFVGLINTLFSASLPLPGLALPVGISFFTFQALSYVIDVYRKDVEPQKNLFHIMLYISFFPQLIAGPIVKYHDIANQITDRKLSADEGAAGMKRFICGLGKKVLIANQMAFVADTLYAVNISLINVCSAWLAAVCYMLQIYFDFSGYSDMAIGLGKMFGFQFRENFNYPYISSSIQEFWRRWHISLSTWFKEYLYIPLGGNRKGKAREYINKLIVFFCTGLWHGANLTFIVWGMWHGFFIVAEQKFKTRMPKILGHIFTLLIVLIGFVMFRADTFMQGLEMISKLFTGWNIDAATMGVFTSVCTPFFLFCLVLGIVLCVPPIWIPARIRNNTILQYVSSLALLAACMLLLSGGTYNPFIYFRF